MREIRLIFRKWGLWEPYYFKIDWPANKPLTLATLDTFDSGTLSEVGSLEARFVIANTPPDSKIYFAVAREKGHEQMEEILRAHGDFYEQRIQQRQGRRFRIPNLLSSRSSRERRLLLASSRTAAIVNDLFKDYAFEWYATSQIPLIIAKNDPEGWTDQLENLTGPRNQRLVRRSVIEESHCLMTTVWEHGMNIVSDKLAPSSLEDSVRKIAADHQLHLTIRRESDGDMDSGHLKASH